MVHAHDWSHPTALCRMLGNSMAANVLLSVMAPLLNAVRPDISMRNPWATGRLQHQLRQSARLEDVGDSVERCENGSNGVPEEPRKTDAPVDTKGGPSSSHEYLGGAPISNARRNGSIYEEIF